MLVLKANPQVMQSKLLKWLHILCWNPLGTILCGNKSSTFTPGDQRMRPQYLTGFWILYKIFFLLLQLWITIKMSNSWWVRAHQKTIQKVKNIKGFLQSLSRCHLQPPLSVVLRDAWGSCEPVQWWIGLLENENTCLWVIPHRTKKLATLWEV